jgi:simple sugar transport system permease protein
MDTNFVVSMLATAITAGTPLLFAAQGEVITERAGIINLGAEGMMLVGAAAGFIATASTGSLGLGIIAACIAGGLLAAIHALLTVTFRANQVVSGLALTIFGTGLSGYIGKSLVGTPSPVKFSAIKIPILSEIPILGTILFNHDLLVYAGFFLSILLWYFFFHTAPGLRLRAIGENPSASDAAGVNVNRLRFFYITVGGMLSGLGGAYLSLAYAPSWLENMTAGRGWIAVALVIFGIWRPMRVMMGAYIFGGIDALGFRLQTLGVGISPFFLSMLPYLFTVIVLIVVTARSERALSQIPAALGLPYNREER